MVGVLFFAFVLTSYHPDVSSVLLTAPALAAAPMYLVSDCPALVDHRATGGVAGACDP